MAVDANAYLSTDAATDNAIPLIYGEDAQLLKVLFESEIMRPYLDDISPLVSGAGHTFQIPIEDTIWAVSALTEGTATPVSALDFSSKNLTITWYGDAKQWTLELAASAFPYVLGRMRENAVAALGENRDNVIITELMTTTSTAIDPTTWATAWDSADIFQVEQVQKAGAEMRVNKLKLANVFYHPYQKLALKEDVRILSNENYNKDVLERGSLVMVDGTQLIEHGSIQSSTIDTQTVYVALACMEKPAFYAQKVAPMFEMDRINILDRAWTFHYFEAFGAKLKRNEGVIPLRSVGGML